jgi:predicted nucleotidyltransferase
MGSRDPIEAIQALVVDAVHPEAIVLFGSRARGDADDRSDIDLAVKAPRASDEEWLKLVAKMDEQPWTLLRVDLVRWEESAPALREAIAREGVVLYESRKATE